MSSDTTTSGNTDLFKRLTKMEADNAALRKRVAALERTAERYRKWIAWQVSVGGGMSIASAQQLNLCRICCKPPTMPLILNFGREYACEKCLKEPNDG